MTSPFPTPTMQCRACGRDPHTGYCDGVGALFIAVCLAVVGVCCIVMATAWLWAPLL